MLVLIGAEKRRSGSHLPHLYSSGKSSSIMWPRTDVNVMSTDTIAPRALDDGSTTRRGSL